MKLIISIRNCLIVSEKGKHSFENAMICLKVLKLSGRLNSEGSWSNRILFAVVFCCCCFVLSSCGREKCWEKETHHIIKSISNIVFTHAFDSTYENDFQINVIRVSYQIRFISNINIYFCFRLKWTRICNLSFTSFFAIVNQWIFFLDKREIKTKKIHGFCVNVFDF